MLRHNLTGKKDGHNLCRQREWRTLQLAGFFGLAKSKPAS
jgi:hypothetical protein